MRTHEKKVFKNLKIWYELGFDLIRVSTTIRVLTRI